MRRALGKIISSQIADVGVDTAVGRVIVFDTGWVAFSESERALIPRRPFPA